MSPTGRGAERLAGTGVRCLQFLVVDDVKANAVEQAEPAGRGQGELDAAWIDLHLLPVDAVKTKPISHQSLGGGRAVERGAGQRQRVVAEESQHAAGAQQPVRLGDPDKGVAPDRGPVFGNGKIVRTIGPRYLLGVAMNPADVQPMLSAEPTGCLKLALRVVDARDRGPSPGHPGRDIAGATTQLDGVHARHVCGQQAHRRLRDIPYAPS